MSRKEREILETLIKQGRLMQVSTLSEGGTPRVCHVWFHATLAPDRLYFISRNNRKHSLDIARNPVVGGGIVSNVPQKLGDKVQGVTFTGKGVEVATGRAVRLLLTDFIRRWPQAREIVTIDRIEKNLTLTRLYEITVDEWALFDEVNFPDEPRIVLPGRLS